MAYTLASIKLAYSLPKSSLMEALARKGLLWPLSPKSWSKDELVSAWLQEFGEPDDIEEAVLSLCECGHRVLYHQTDSRGCQQCSCRKQHKEAVC
jgi:hypothetical protein